ncbi:hypothetical protein H4219_004346 [Mycoemilia scoparia]|uniref:Uncharacterized protein n=1 Tax=Mycoemilia scoparia TaxID=417184 RepID=A0A9W8DS16_9FUNG|nr:hypothetical protein H4219_004346 [Mycoemilia scoparia]
MHFTKFVAISIAALGFVSTVSTVDAREMERPKLTPEQEKILKPALKAIDTLEATSKNNYSGKELNDAVKAVEAGIKKVRGTPNSEQVVKYLDQKLFELTFSI